ncbi:MAG: hypothetical protein Q8M15_13970 [Bacteroidota bacterium]|nr:hypothetical protein [Bacteroidota bacterium]
MKKILIIAVIAIFALTACKKTLMDKVTPPSDPNKVSQFNQIKASANFDWKTTKAIQLNVQGFATQAPINKTLWVTTVDGKTVYFNAMHLMDQNLTAQLAIPSNVQEVLVSYGTISKKYSTQLSSIIFDFMPEIVPE